MGSSGGGSKSTSTSTSYTPEQAKWMGKALEMYGPEMGQGQQIYPGETVAGFSPLQEQLLGGAGAYSDLFKPVTGADIPLYGQTGDVLSDAMAGRLGAQPITPEQTGAYFKQVYEDPSRKTFQEETLPGVREAFAGPGYFGSARGKAEMEANQEYGNWLGEQRGQLEWNVLQSNQALQEAQAARQLGAAGMAESYGTQMLRENLTRLTGSEELFNFASQDQAQQQRQITAAMQKFEAGNRLTDPEVMSIMLTLLGQQYQTTTQSQTTAGSSMLGTAIGAGIGLLAAPATAGLSSMFSAPTMSSTFGSTGGAADFANSWMGW